MSTIRLYVDEDAMHTGLIAGLRARSVDVQSVLEAGLAGEDDEAQLTYAAQSGRTMYTFNVRDFCRIHSEWQSVGRSHAGVIVVPRQRYSVGEQLRRLLQRIDATSAERMADQLVFL